MNTPTLTSVLPDQAEAVGMLVYEAFKEIAERHNFEPAFATPELAHFIVRLLAQTEGYESYQLIEDGRPVACNFGDERDDAVGVGPVAVAVDQQGRGLGRRVMEALLERAERNGFRSVRLVQVAYNMQSFSLYHNLGFNVTDMLANVRGRPGDGQEPIDRVREYTPADLAACDTLHREVLGIGRRQDIELMAKFAPPLVLERGGQIAGYLTRFPGPQTFITHGVARDEQALRDLIISTGRSSPGDVHLLIPTSHAETLRWAMGQGFQLQELDSYMVYGEYQPPMGAWVPSPFY
jgi:ribosomal protein S18 acetylase RimI-like enzyme